MEHRAAPHDRRVLLEEEADRHQLQVAADRRHDHLVDDDRPLADAEHVRDRVPVDVRVEDARPLAELVEGGREIHREGRLADAALAARDREHTRRRVDGDALRALGDAAAQPLRQRGALLRAHDVELERDGLDARQRQQVLAHLALEARAKRAAGNGERDRDGDIAVGHAHLTHHVELGDRPLQLRIDNASEGFRDLLARRLLHSASVAAVSPRAAASARGRS